MGSLNISVIIDASYAAQCVSRQIQSAEFCVQRNVSSVHTRKVSSKSDKVLVIMYIRR